MTEHFGQFSGFVSSGSTTAITTDAAALQSVRMLALLKNVPLESDQTVQTARAACAG
jgi:hypothetical protein